MEHIKSGATIGIIGGGQLAKMMCFEAHKLGYNSCVLSDDPNAVAFAVTNNSVLGDYHNYEIIDKFIANVAVVTFEFENIPYETLKYISERAIIRPTIQAIFISQDRILEKNFINKLNIRTTDYISIDSYDTLCDGAEKYQYNAILKTTRLGYDGKGQFNIDQTTDLEALYQEADKLDIPLILERKINFTKELSIIVARDVEHNIINYDLVENIHNSGILHKTIAPADIAPEISLKAQEIADKILTKLDYIGVMAIEFFLDEQQELLVNEFAPRPHNSGHFTIDACYHNQFEQAIRAAAGLPVLSGEMHSAALMTNLIGDEIKQISQLEKLPLHKIHNYNKNNIKAGRKMGHYTQLKRS